MRHFGIFCLSATGHLNPALALGWTLVQRGNRVTCFQGSIARGVVRAAGVGFALIDQLNALSSGFGAQSRPHLRTLEFLHAHAAAVLTGGPAVVGRAKPDALIVDQADLAAGSIAERFGLPFVTVSFFPPVLLDSWTPPSIFHWSYASSWPARVRNVVGNALFRHLFADTLRLVNTRRHEWGLSPLRHLHDTTSKRALIAQLPECLDFPRSRVPAHMFHTGPFFDPRSRYAVSFPWERLTGEPIVYASMGTVRNDQAHVFSVIAEACAPLPVQLVVSLGGTLAFGDSCRWGQNSIVVPYAPQLDLLRVAQVTVTHGGLNTTLESLAHGVPLVAIPVTDDQPGVAARIRWAGVGTVLPIERLSVTRLRRKIDDVLTDGRYRAAARRLQDSIGDGQGLQLAADIVERMTAPMAAES